MRKAIAIVAAALCGALCGALLGFPWASRFAGIAPLTLFPLFYGYRSGNRAMSAALSALYVAAAYLVGLEWIYEGAVAHQGAGDYYTAFIGLLFQVLPYALAGFAASYACRFSAPLWCATVASTWTLFEYWRATSTFGIPYLRIGHALIDTPLVGIARVAGTESLTFVCVLVAAMLFEARHLRVRTRALAWTLFAVVAAANALFQAPAPAVADRGAALSIFQLGLADDTSVSPYLTALQSLPSESQVAIWPESGLRLSRYTVSNELRRAARARHIALLTGGFVADASGMHDALEFIDSDGNVRGYYAKRQLVPFGEFVPLPGLAHAIIPATLVARMPNLSAGNAPITFAVGRRTIGPLICYESAFPGLAREDVLRGANLLVAATNDAWFASTSGVWELKQTARLVAIETGTPLVLSGTVGPSGVIDADGRWTGSLPVGSVASATFFAPRAHRTLYDAIGDLPWIVAMSIVCIAALAAAMWSSRALQRLEARAM